jgi:hypothetical protein
MLGARAQVVLLLDGQRLGRYTFEGGVLRTAEPVAWPLPDGRGSAPAALTLAFGAALVYGRYKGASATSYIGPQANGVLWADPAQAPLGWPIGPPQVSGKVRAAPAPARTQIPSPDTTAVCWAGPGCAER